MSNHTTLSSSASRRGSIINIIDVIKQQDASKGELLAKNQKSLYDLKREISVSSKKNFALERDIRTLDKKIALLIKNRITLEEVMASSGLIDFAPTITTLKDRKEREFYGQLFYLLQRDTGYIAQLARLVKAGEIDNLLQTVMFTLYGNQYEENEEHLLLSMFQAVLQYEFEEATGLGSLLRANTALTRMMTTYTRRGPGQQYLKQTLTNVLKYVTEQKDMCMEINPVKVYESYIIDYETTTGKPFTLNRKPTPEEAAANPDVQGIIGPRVKALEDMSNTFLNAILTSTDLVPYGIRWICKQIRELTRAKFPQATRAQTCSLIGGFFLLRFINPAIVTPQAFMLVDAKLSVNTRRNLTLLAKILQNLANNVQFGGVKEFFMEPLNPFLDKSKDRLNDFLENLTRVDNLSEHLMLDKYLALGKTTDTVINISINEMYFVHSLLQQHLEVLTDKEKDNPLRIVLSEMGPAPPQLPRGENATVDLKLSNRFENEPTNALNMRPERMYNETKYLLFYVLKILPHITNEDNGDIKKQIEFIDSYAKEKKDADLMEKSKKIIHNCRKLVSDGLLSDEDNYAVLRRDIIQELMNYETYIQKTTTDLDRLKQVRQAIQEHNVFLQQQLQTYEVYLVNVKKQSLPNTATDEKSEKKHKDKADKKEKSSSRKKQAFKFSHVQLEKDAIIISSEIPEERRSNIFFSFTAPNPGTFTVTVLYKTRVISEMNLQLDELLERQANNAFEYETEFLTLNVNLLVYLLNKTFIG